MTTLVPLSQAVPIVSWIRQPEKQALFNAWDYALKTGAIRLYGRAGPKGELTLIDEEQRVGLIIEYSRSRALYWISDRGCMEARRHLHVDGGIEPKPAPFHHQPRLFNADARLDPDDCWALAEPVDLIKLVTSFGLQRHVYERVLNLWVQLAERYPDDHRLWAEGSPTAAPISQKEARKQLQGIETAAQKLLALLRAAHPDVAEAWELARGDTKSDQLVPTYAKNAGSANAMAYVARCAQESRWLKNLPSELPRGRPTDRIADALIVELAALWFAETGAVANSREVPGKGDEPNRGGKFVIAVGALLLGSGRINARRLRSLVSSSKK